jgi:hypothetical protein
VISDWLYAGGLIKARLESVLTGIAGVRIVSGANEAAQIVTAANSIFVAWLGDSGLDYGGRGKISLIAQRWQVILAVRPGDTAGAGLSTIITALAGHELSDKYDELKFTGGSAAIFTGDYVLYPLNFEVAIYAG